MMPPLKTPLFSIFLCLLLNGCYQWTRLNEFGATPPLTPTQDPTAHKGYKPVRMPMPEQTYDTHAPNSLWRTGAKAFFKDQRASRVGDIVTVRANTTEKIEFKNETTNKKDPGEIDSSLTSFFGQETKIPNPRNTSPVGLIQAETTIDNKGKNDMKRKELFDFKVAATVVQILPNGNMVIMGRQEIKMNFEVREIVLSGVICPSDISSNNTVNLDQIAEARITYSGRGDGTDIQKLPWGQSLAANLMPF